MRPFVTAVVFDFIRRYAIFVLRVCLYVQLASLVVAGFQVRPGRAVHPAFVGSATTTTTTTRDGVRFVPARQSVANVVVPSRSMRQRQQSPRRRPRMFAVSSNNRDDRRSHRDPSMRSTLTVDSEVKSASSSNSTSSFASSATTDSSRDEAKGGTRPEDKTKDRETRGQQRHLDMPWGDIQAWALRDQLPLHTIQLPVMVEGRGGGGMKTTRETMRSYVLWRTMSEEVAELSGYPLSFLVERAREQELLPSSADAAAGNSGDEILPYLDEFEFVASGGLSGRAYGVKGVADGTIVQTTPVDNVRITVPKGFVRTSDGCAVYELGRPTNVEDDVDHGAMYSLDGRTKLARDLAGRAADLGLSSAKALSSKLDGRNVGGSLVDPELINLAGLTACVIGGAMAVETLSHHLTINVFWV